MFFVEISKQHYVYLFPLFYSEFAKVLIRGELHLQVAKRVIFMLNNEHLTSLIARNQNRTVILPIIFEALEMNVQTH